MSNVKNGKEKVTLDDLYAYLRESEEKFNRNLEKMREETRKMAEEERKYREEERKRKKEFEREKAEIWREKRETDRQLKETDRQLKESIKESKETNRDLKESIRETDRQMKKTDEKIREVSSQLGGIGHSNGDVAEEYFINAFKKNPNLNGETYDKVMHNVRFVPEEIERCKEYNDEYDIFLLNGKSIAIISIKYNIKRDAINEIIKKAENFRKFQPRYNNHNLYLGIAGLSFRKITEENILRKGIAVIKQVGDKMVIHDENLRVF